MRLANAIGRIGGDETTVLELMAIRPTEDDTYYVFRQQAGDVLVNGATVKLVVDKDGKVEGLISAILPNVKAEELGSWEISQEQAEAVALENARQQGGGNADALSGDAAAFTFENMEKGVWEGAITLHDGTTRQVSVPTIIDPETGEAMLGDADRKILCADYAQFTYNETISPRTEQDGRFNDQEVAIYDTFISVWDFYDSIGWTGPDGEGTPTLLCMDYVYEDGRAVSNACYNGRQWGFQTFAFNRNDPDGECTDIITHEFTHCVTNTALTSTEYLNDYGAINEAMSDIMGDLVEMIADGNMQGAWLIGEGAGADKMLRSMRDPHALKQPEFAWDVYYLPNVAKGTDLNDNGGVHSNSSLLSLVSYKLNEAGMQPEEQVYFWMNVELALTPRTDYPQLAEMLPWCMEQAGYSQYVDALKAAIDDAKFTAVEAPAELPEGAGTVRLVYPDKELAANGGVAILLFPEDGSDWLTAYPLGEDAIVTAIVPAGDYTILEARGTIQDPSFRIATNDGWVALVGEAAYQPERSFHVEAGEVIELTAEGL